MKLALLVSCAALAGCVSFNWQRTAAFQPPAEGALAGLRPGSSDLGACLAVLGAPHGVSEQADGFTLIYAWLDASDKGVSVRASAWRSFDASLSYLTASDRFQGVVLFFDRDARLTGMQEGLLGTLRTERRPLLIDDDRLRAEDA